MMRDAPDQNATRGNRKDIAKILLGGSNQLTRVAAERSRVPSSVFSLDFLC